MARFSSSPRQKFVAVDDGDFAVMDFDGAFLFESGQVFGYGFAVGSNHVGKVVVGEAELDGESMFVETPKLFG